MKLNPYLERTLDVFLSQAGDMDRNALLSNIVSLGIVRLNAAQIEAPARKLDAAFLGELIDADMAALEAAQRERLASVGIAGVILPARR